MNRKYQITLMNWFTRKKKDFILSESLMESKVKLKEIKKRQGIMWIRATPIHC